MKTIEGLIFGILTENGTWHVVSIRHTLYAFKAVDYGKESIFVALDKGTLKMVEGDFMITPPTEDSRATLILKNAYGLDNTLNGEDRIDTLDKAMNRFKTVGTFSISDVLNEELHCNFIYEVSDESEYFSQVPVRCLPNMKGVTVCFYPKDLPTEITVMVSDKVTMLVVLELRKGVKETLTYTIKENYCICEDTTFPSLKDSIVKFDYFSNITVSKLGEMVSKNILEQIAAGEAVEEKGEIALQLTTPLGKLYDAVSNTMCASLMVNDCVAIFNKNNIGVEVYLFKGNCNECMYLMVTSNLIYTFLDNCVSFETSTKVGDLLEYPAELMVGADEAELYIRYLQIPSPVLEAYNSIQRKFIHSF